MEQITIPMSEYKELLEIKGKYEEVLRREGDSYKLKRDSIFEDDNKRIERL